MLKTEKQALLDYHILTECGLANPDIDKIKNLLTNGADVNMDNGINHQTILMISLDKQHLLVAEFLVKAGADINLTDGLGRSALVGAAKDGNLEAVRFLLKHGADHSLTSNQGNTALILAIVNGEHEVAELLIQSGADVELPDGKGSTPLIIAASKVGDKLDIIKLLIEYGANPLAEDNKGATAMSKSVEYASRNGIRGGASNLDTIAFLECCIEHKQIFDDVNKAQAASKSSSVKPRN